MLKTAGDLGRGDAGEGEVGDGVLGEEGDFEGFEAGAGCAGLDLAEDQELVDVEWVGRDVGVLFAVEYGEELEGAGGEAGSLRGFRG